MTFIRLKLAVYSLSSLVNVTLNTRISKEKKYERFRRTSKCSLAQGPLFEFNLRVDMLTPSTMDTFVMRWFFIAVHYVSVENIVYLIRLGKLF